MQDLRAIKRAIACSSGQSPGKKEKRSRSRASKHSHDELVKEPAPDKDDELVEGPELDKDLSKAMAFLQDELALPGGAGASQSDVSAERPSPAEGPKQPSEAEGPKQPVMSAEEGPLTSSTPPVHPITAESSSDKALSISSSSAAEEEGAGDTPGAEDVEEEKPTEMDAVVELSSSDEELPEELKCRARAALQSARAFECAGGVELCASGCEHVKEGTHTWPPALQS